MLCAYVTLALVLRLMESNEALVPRICEIYDRLAPALAHVWGSEDADYKHCEKFVLDFVQLQKARSTVTRTEDAKEERPVDKRYMHVY